MSITAKKFSIDYSVRGTAKCKVCKKVIVKNELRIGKSVQFKDRHYLQYLHVSCAFKQFRKAKVSANVITCISQLQGSGVIDDKDKDQIINLIKSENAERILLLPTTLPKKENKSPQAPPHIRKSQLKSSNEPSINVLFTNADQLTTSKMTELRKRIQQERPLVIAICEVKPKNSKERHDYKIPGYSLHSINLENQIGRGIALYTHASLDQSVVQITPDLSYEEICLLEVKLRGGDLMLFGCFYRSPTPSATSDKNNNDLNRILYNISRNKYSHKCLIGDFNFKDINWVSWTTFHNENSKEAKFIETARDCYLYQHNLQNSRRRGNDEPSLIDLIFSDESMHVSDVEHHAPLGKSDHDVITFKFNCYLDYAKPKDRYVYHKADFEAMRNSLIEENWTDEYINKGYNMSCEELWSIIKSKLLELRGKFVPQKTSTTTPSWKEIGGGFPIDSRLKTAIREKHASHRRWMSALRRNNAEGAHQDYAKARNKVKRMMRQSKRRFESDIAKKSKSNPKAFWSHVRSRLKTKEGIAPLREDPKIKDSVKFTDKEKADILQNQFASVFTREPDGDIPNIPLRTNGNICNVQVTSEMVKDEITNMNVNKSCGPDDIHPRMLQELLNYISTPIAILLNKSMREGTIPKDWKQAYVTPIYKKGPKSIAENYRPISLTSVVCKLMESFIKYTIMNHLRNEKLMSPKQFGFISGRSTTTQLLNYLNKCIDKIVEGNVVDSIYLDFAKAFDSVPHKRLLHKIASYGITGNILRWIEAFLTDRTQTVKVNESTSDLAAVLSGIPQGSVLGPILFIIYINDLLDNIKSDGLLFADDTKIFHTILSRDDALALQSDIDKLEKWSDTWLLKFNPDKCHVLSLGRFENIKHTQRYSIYGAELEHVFEEKDLGVTIDSELNFDGHIALKVKKANALVGIIRRTFSFLNCNLFRKLYTSFVRPHLEYAQVIWAPHLKKNINMVENVQIRATKLVDGLCDLDYRARLIKLNLPTLAHRRVRGAMIEMYKHFNNYDNETLSGSFQPRQRTTRAHNHQLYERIPKDGSRGIQTNSFYYRYSRTWNNLPSEVVNSKGLNSFKNSLDKHWENEPSKYDHLV